LNLIPGKYAPVAGLLVVGLGVSLAAMDLAVNVAFPAITAAFALPTEAIRWVVIWYVLTYSGLMLLFGRLGDRVGHRRVFRAGLLTSVAAFALCALATEYYELLLARIVQGVATALVMSCAPALATLLFDESKRTRALGAYTSLTALAGVAAPLIGGVSITALGWAGVFWFRLPIALLALALLPLLRAAHTPSPSGASSLSSAALRVPAFVLPNLGSIAVHFVAFAVPLLVPYYLARVGGFAPAEIGAVLALSPIGTLIGSAVAAPAVRRMGAHRGAVLAGALVALGSVAISTWPQTALLPLILATLLLHGVGLGLFQVAYADIVLAALPRHDRGVAGSLTMVTRTLGVIAAAGVLTAALDVFQRREAAIGADPVAALVGAFGSVFLCTGVVLGVLIALGGLARMRSRR